jgi:hypothetical protein
MTENYSISNPSHFNGVVPRFIHLQNEIANSSIANTISHITRVDDNVDIVFDTQLSASEKTTLDGLVSGHNPANFISYYIVGQVIPRNSEFTQTDYKRAGTFEYSGTSTSSEITRISAVSYQDSGVTNYSIRIYDEKNNKEIAIGTFTNETEDICVLDSISNLPTESSIFEVQVKKTGGNGKMKVHVDTVTFYSN